MNTMFKLSKNFSLSELISSGTAQAHNLANTPDEKDLGKLKRLCTDILQPVRDHFGQPVRRSEERRVG